MRCISYFKGFGFQAAAIFRNPWANGRWILPAKVTFGFEIFERCNQDAQDNQTVLDI
jgi:hypothetical protein